MKHITQTIDNLIYGYDPREFMPIRREGQLVNRGEFATYKLKCLDRSIRGIMPVWHTKNS